MRENPFNVKSGYQVQNNPLHAIWILRNIYRSQRINPKGWPSWLSRELYNGESQVGNPFILSWLSSSHGAWSVQFTSLMWFADYYSEMGLPCMHSKGSSSRFPCHQKEKIEFKTSGQGCVFFGWSLEKHVSLRIICIGGATSYVTMLNV